MITCFFGVPRVGKNTFLTMIAQRELARIKKGRSIYKHIYTDFYCEGCERIKFDDIGKYKIYDSLLLFEVMGLDADGRAYKTFSNGKRDFLVLHGQFHNDIIYATQDYSNVDKKLRDLTQELWYLEKSCVPFLENWTVATRIFRNININEFTSDLVVGYRFSTLLEKLFTKVRIVCFRPFYYRKFESWNEGSLASREVLQTELWQRKRRATPS